jgi:hypothetical protein
MTGLDTLERETVDVDTGNAEPPVAHIADATKVTEAYVMGMPIEALCGKVFVPSRNPDGLEVCFECKEIAEVFYLSYS